VPQCTCTEPVEVSAMTVGCPQARQVIATGFGNRIIRPPPHTGSQAGGAYGTFEPTALPSL
jgi:hypothetical protein